MFLILAACSGPKHEGVVRKLAELETQIEMTPGIAPMQERMNALLTELKIDPVPDEKFHLQAMIKAMEFLADEDRQFKKAEDERKEIEFDKGLEESAAKHKLLAGLLEIYSKRLEMLASPKQIREKLIIIRDNAASLRKELQP